MCAQVKCADCGFLAARLMKSRELVDPEQEMRQNGSIPSHGNEALYDSRLICIVSAFDLVAETGEDPGAPERKKITQKERACEKFTKRHPGFTPKEHVEMNLLEEQREWQQEESKNQRQWQADESAKAEARHRDSVAIALSGNKGNVWSNIATGVLALVATIIGSAVTWLLTAPAK